MESKEVVGIDIPLKLEINFLKYVVIPSFDEDLELANKAARKAWMRTTAADNYGNRLDHLMRAFNIVSNLGEAKVMLEKLERKEQEEREILLLERKPGG